MSTSNLVIVLLFFSLQLLVNTHARSLSTDWEPKTTATATILLPIHKPDSTATNTKSADNDTSVPLTKVTFRHIGHLRFPLHRPRSSHGFDRLIPVVRSRLDQRLFDDDVILLHERHGGFGRRSHGWNKMEGRHPFRVYLGKPSFEVWRNGMQWKKPYVEVHDNRQSHYHYEKVKGVLRKIRKFLTQF